jgi:cyclopropane-fatty-acyl-phospholipid synthase
MNPEEPNLSLANRSAVMVGVLLITSTGRGTTAHGRSRPMAFSVEPRATEETPPGRLTMAQVLESLTDRPVDFRFTAYDGSATGPVDSSVGIHLASPRGVAYLATAPGALGMARAYVSNDLQIRGVHAADPYPLLQTIGTGLSWRKPDPRTLAAVLKSLGPARLIPPSPPPQEALPDWRRILEGFRHTRKRDAEAIHHHYDVSNRFYELMLGNSMTYSCAYFPDGQTALDEAQSAKYDLIARKLGLKPGMRLLDVGCGWGGMLRHAAKNYGVRALGVTLSAEQAAWARTAIEKDRLEHLVEVRHQDYRDLHETNFDAISSIGFMEHVGIGQLADHVQFLHRRLRPGGRLLNHCITRPNATIAARKRGGFIDRYIFPDGEITASGRIITELQNAGFEVRHSENLREHYALTCTAWSRNLVEHWDECVAEVGEETGKIWGLFVAGSRLGFEQNTIQLHQVLAVKLHPDGRSDYPLRHEF